MIWYNYYKEKSDIQISKDILDTLKEAELFYSSMFTAIYFGLTIPATFVC